MKLNYEPKFEVSDGVYRLSKERQKLNDYQRMLELQMVHKSPTVSLETIALIKKEALSILKKSEKMKEVTGLDAVVLEDIQSNAQKALAQNEYLFNCKGNVKFTKFLSTMYGNGAYAEVLKAVQERETSLAIHKYFELMHKINNNQIDEEILLNSDKLKEAKKALLGIVESYKKQIERFFGGIAHSFSAEDYDVYISPYDFSFWEEGSRMMSIQTDLIPGTKTKTGRQEKYHFTKSLGLVIAIHEAGHVLQDSISKICIPSVSYRVESSNPTFHGMTNEGVSLICEDFAIPWLVRNRRALGLEDEIALAKVFVKAYLPTRICDLAYELIDIKEREDHINDKMPEKFKTEAGKEMTRITGLPLFVKDFHFFSNTSLLETLWFANYFFGHRRISNIANKAKKEFGISMGNEKQSAILLQGLMTGIWTSHSAKEKFLLEHFLPQAVRDGVL